MGYLAKSLAHLTTFLHQADRAANKTEEAREAGDHSKAALYDRNATLHFTAATRQKQAMEKKGVRLQNGADGGRQGQTEEGSDGIKLTAARDGDGGNSTGGGGGGPLEKSGAPIPDDIQAARDAQWKALKDSGRVTDPARVQTALNEAKAALVKAREAHKDNPNALAARTREIVAAFVKATKGAVADRVTGRKLLTLIQSPAFTAYPDDNAGDDALKTLTGATPTATAAAKKAREPAREEEPVAKRDRRHLYEFIQNRRPLEALRRDKSGNFLIGNERFSPETFSILVEAFRARPKTLKATLRLIVGSKFLGTNQKIYLSKLARRMSKSGGAMTKLDRDWVSWTIPRHISDDAAEFHRSNEQAKKVAFVGALGGYAARKNAVRIQRRLADPNPTPLRRRLLKTELRILRSRPYATISKLFLKSKTVKFGDKQENATRDAYHGRIPLGPGWRPFRRFISARAFKYYPPEGAIDPNRVRTSQPQAAARHSRNGKTIEENARNLANGTQDPNKMGPPIRLVVYEGRVYSLDHRRLIAFRRANNYRAQAGLPPLKIPYRRVSYSELNKAAKGRVQQAISTHYGRYVVVVDRKEGVTKYTIE